MKTASKLVLGLSMALLVGLLARAEDKKDGEDSAKSGGGKEVTLMGTITCAKCDLKLQDKCNTVVKVSKDGKDTVYFFDKASNKKYHSDTCQEAKKGSVTGSTAEKDGKQWITVTKLEYAK
jgi:hypothetical protein